MVASSAISLPETVMLRDLADSSGVSSLPLNIKDQRRYFEGHRQTDLDTTVSTTSTPCSPEKVSASIAFQAQYQHRYSSR